MELLDRAAKRARVGGDAPEFASPEEEEQALRLARIAKRAEMKASGNEPLDVSERLKDQGSRKAAAAAADDAGAKPKFLTKAEREKAALERLQQRRSGAGPAVMDMDDGLGPSSRRASAADGRSASRSDEAREKELQVMREQYLGKKVQKKRIVKPSEKFAKIF